MFLKALTQSKRNKTSLRKLFFLSLITITLLNKENVFPKPIENQNIAAEFKISNISFITKAIKKTGASVVTIETQKFISNRKLEKIDENIINTKYFHNYLKKYFCF